MTLQEHVTVANMLQHMFQSKYHCSSCFHVSVPSSLFLFSSLLSHAIISNTDGQALLKRLKYAFLHGLTFTVGTSITTGTKNQCTWASIHHKTDMWGGVQAHGYPDPDYFKNCNDEMDGLGVPPANSLDEDGLFLTTHTTTQTVASGHY